jgi:hypothetical protein
MASERGMTPPAVRREPSPMCVLAIVVVAAIGVLVVPFLSVLAEVM